MDDARLAVSFGKLRILCTNVLGFHALTGMEGAALTEVDRLMYQAQVFAGGVALAQHVVRIAIELDRRQEP